MSTGKASSTRKAVTSWFQVKMGMRNMTMPGRSQAEDRGDHVDGGEDAGEAGQGHAHDPQVAARAQGSGWPR